MRENIIIKELYEGRVEKEQKHKPLTNLFLLHPGGELDHGLWMAMVNTDCCQHEIFRSRRISNKFTQS